MISSMWLVLDNLAHGWAYWTNMKRNVAEKAYRACIDRNFIKPNGLLTSSGKIFLSVTYKSARDLH